MIKMGRKCVFIMNGRPGVGKDTFVGMCNDLLVGGALSESSINIYKQIARIIGWDGIKDPKSSKLLHSLKAASIEYNDYPTKHIDNLVRDFMEYSNCDVMFIDIRESAEIDKAMGILNRWKSGYNTGAASVLIRSDVYGDMGRVESNESDRLVEEYEDYDEIIYNNSTLDDLRRSAELLLLKYGGKPNNEYE